MPRRKETRGRKKVLTKEQYAQNQKESSARWHKQNTKNIVIGLNIATDSAILDKLSSVPNKTAYIRQLILNDLKN